MVFQTEIDTLNLPKCCCCSNISLFWVGLKCNYVIEVTKARITLVRSASRRKCCRCRPEETVLEDGLPARLEVSLDCRPLANGKYISTVKGTGKFLLSFGCFPLNPDTATYLLPRQGLCHLPSLHQSVVSTEMRSSEKSGMRQWLLMLEAFSKEFIQDAAL